MVSPSKLESTLKGLRECLEGSAAIGVELKHALTVAKRAGDDATVASLVEAVTAFTQSTASTCLKAMDVLEVVERFSEEPAGRASVQQRRQSRTAAPASPERSPVTAALPFSPDSQRSTATTADCEDGIATPVSKARGGRKRQRLEPAAPDEGQEAMQSIDLGRLRLERALVAFHLESTGLDTVQDRLVGFAAVRVEPDGTFSGLHHLVDPGVPMPPETTAVNGITDAHLAGKPAFAELAGDIWQFFEGADILGYNALAFQVPLLAAEFARVAAGCSGARNGSRTASCTFQFPPAASYVVDPAVIGTRNLDGLKFKLATAYRRFCGAELESRPPTLLKAAAALQVLRGQLDCFPAVPNTVLELHQLYTTLETPPQEHCLDAVSSQNDPPSPRIQECRWFRWVDGEAYFTFGAHDGEALAEVAETESDYLEWMLRQDFGPTADDIVRRALEEAQLLDAA